MNFVRNVRAFYRSSGLYNVPWWGTRGVSDIVEAGTRGTSGSLSSVRTLLIDTLDLMKKFEGIGFSRKQSEALTNHVTQIIEASRDRIATRYVPKSTLDKALLEHQSQINTFKSELQKAQDLQLGNVVKDTERLQGSLDKMKVDVKHEIDKLTSSQRLDLNLEKGRMRDELQSLRDKLNDLELKIDREINALKAAVELTKNETIKYVVAILGTFTAAAIGIARLGQQR